MSTAIVVADSLVIGPHHHPEVTPESGARPVFPLASGEQVHESVQPLSHVRTRSALAHVGPAQLPNDPHLQALVFCVITTSPASVCTLNPLRA